MRSCELLPGTLLLHHLSGLFKLLRDRLLDVLNELRLVLLGQLLTDLLLQHVHQLLVRGLLLPTVLLIRAKLSNVRLLRQELTSKQWPNPTPGGGRASWTVGAGTRQRQSEGRSQPKSRLQFRHSSLIMGEETEEETTPGGRSR